MVDIANELKATQAPTLMMYGDSGGYKTTGAFYAAKYYYNLTGKKVRLIAAEDSTKLIFEPLIRADIVDAVFMTKSVNPLVDLRNLGRGLWPVGGKWIATTPGEVSAYIIEGLTSLSELLLEDLREKHRMLGEQKGNSFEEGGEKFAKSSQFNYGFVQEEVLRAIKAFAAIPGIRRVVWTAHEVKAVDGDNQSIRGPALAGVAKTPHVRKYCGVMLHHEVYSVDKIDPLTKEKRTDISVRVWFKDHADHIFPAIHYPAKVTLPTSQILELDKHFPGGYFIPTLTDGLDKFLAVEAGLLSSATGDLSTWKKEVDSRLAQTVQGVAK